MQKKNPLRLLWQMLIEEKSEIMSIYFYAILSGLIQLSVPIGVQAIIGFVLGASMVTSIYILIFVVVLGVCAVGLIQINQMKIIEKIQQKIFARYSFAFSEKSMYLDLRQTQGIYLPEKMNRFFDIITIQKGISKLLLELPIASIQIVFGLLLLCLYHPIFIIFGFSLLLILWLIMRVTGKKGFESSLEESTYKYHIASWLQDLGRNIVQFKFYSRFNLNLRRTDDLVSSFLDARTRHFHVLLLQFKVLVAFKTLITLAMLAVGTYLLLAQELNIGEFIAAEIVILSIIGAIEKLIGNTDNIYDVLTAFAKISAVLDADDEANGSMSPPNEAAFSIELKEFCFFLPQSNLAFAPINLKLEPGNRIWLRGQSGKTYFLHLLGLVVENFTGAYYINGIALGNFDREIVRSHIGFIGQENPVFHGTVMDNIAMGRSSIEPQRITQFAQKLGFSEFLNSLSSGYDTVLEAEGNNWSYRALIQLSFLRLLLARPALILIDNAFSALSEEQQVSLSTYLQEEITAPIVITGNESIISSICNTQFELQN